MHHSRRKHGAQKQCEVIFSDSLYAQRVVNVRSFDGHLVLRRQLKHLSEKL